MKVVLQRVKNAYVEVDGNKISEIDNGLLLLWGIEQGDSDADSEVPVSYTHLTLPTNREV